MKKLITNTIFFSIFALVGVVAFASSAQAYNPTPYCSYYVPCGTQINSYSGYYYPDNYDPYWMAYTPSYQQSYTYNNPEPYWYYGSQAYTYDNYYYGNNYSANAYGFYGQSSSQNYRRDNDDKPRVNTDSARSVNYHSAELRGEVDMRDAENGRAFFVYGEDRNDVEDVEDEDEYSDVDENGDDLQKVLVDSNLDDGDEEDYERTVYGLDNDTRIYFRLCVEFEDEDGDEKLECGDVENFRTDD